MSDYESKVKISVDDSELSNAEKRIKNLKDKDVKFKLDVTGKDPSKTIDNIGTAAKGSEKAIDGMNQSMGNVAKSTLSAAVSYKVFNETVKQLKEAVSEVEALNSALTTVHMTMENITNADLSNLKSQILDISNELSAYTKTVSDAVEIYANANESINTIMQKTEPTVLLATASRTSASDAADTVQGILNQFKMTDDAAMGVVDTLEGLSAEMKMDFAKGIQNVSEAVKVSGSVIDSAGMSFEKYASIVSATTESTRLSGSILGNAFKTISSRIGRSKDGETTDAERSNAETALNSVGVSVRNANGDIRDLSLTLDDLSKVWGNLTRSQQNYIAEQSAGIRQISIFRNMMDNYDRSLELEQKALNSSGTALKINETRAESIDGKLQKLSSTTSKLYNDAISEEAVMSLIDFADGLVKVVDKLGLLQGALTALGVSGIAKGINLIRSNWQKLLAIFTGTTGKVALGVGAVVSIYSVLKKRQEELRQSAIEATSSWSEANNTLQEQISKYKELKSQLDSGTLSSSEEYEIKQQILDIQTQITSQYSDQVSGIDMVNGSLQTQLGILQQISAENAKTTLNENHKEYEKAEDEMTKSRSYNLGYVTDAFSVSKNHGEITKFAKELKVLIEQYDELELVSNSKGTHIEFTGDASQAQEVIDDFMNKVKELDSLEGYEDYATSILNQSSESLKNNREKVLDNYQSSYKTFLQMDMISQGTGEGSVADTFNKYTEAVEAYNEALASGDSGAINKARSDFAKLRDDVDNIISDEDTSKFSTLFDDVTDQLNEASVKAYDFNEAISGKAGKNNQFKNTSDDIKKASDDLKNLKIDAMDALGALKTSGEQTGEDEIWKLAEAWGITAESSEEEMESFVDVLSKAGIVSGNLGDSVEQVSQSLSDLATNTQKVISGISSVTDVLSKQSTGKSISLDDFNSDELKDYQSALEYVNGSMQLNEEKVIAITKAKSEEAIATNKANKAQKQSEYLKNAGEIEQLRNKLKNLTEGTTEYNDTKSRLDSLMSTNTSIANECKQYDLLTSSIKEATSAYSNWLSAQSGSDYGDMFNDSLDAYGRIMDTYNSESDIYGDFGSKKFDVAVDFIVPDTVDSNDADAIKSYMDNFKQYLTFDENGKANGMNIEQFCRNAMDKGLMVLDEAGENYQIAGETTMEDFANGLNLSLPMVQAFFDELQLKGGEFSWADEAIKTVGDLGVKAYESAEALRSIEGYSDLEIKMDVSGMDNLDDKLSTLDGTIQQMNNLKAQPEVDPSQIEYANDIIQYCVAQKQKLSEPVFMTIDTSQVDGELGEVIGLIQQLQSAKNEYDIQASVGADTTEAQGKIDNLVSQIQDKDATIKAKIGDVDTSNVDTILADVSKKSAEAWVTLGVKDEAIAGYVPENKTAKVTYELDTYAVDTYNPKNLKRTVTYKVVTEGEAPKVNGTAHIKGTAHMSGTVKSNPIIGKALASGEWGVNKTETALVGELGQELVVYGSRYWTVGDKGAEFTAIPKGAIVFNHKQTEEILKNGYVTSGGGRGHAYASGTAYVTGGIPVSNAKMGSYSSSSSSNKTPTSSNDDLYDFIEILLDRTKELTSKLTDAIDDAVNLADKMSKNSSALSQTQKEISVNQQAYQRYMAQANAVGLDEGYASQLRNGSLNIENISDEDLKKKVDQYKNWFEKAKNVQDAIRDLQKDEKDLALSRLEYIEDWYDALVSLNDAYKDVNDTRLEYLEKIGSSAISDQVEAYYQNSYDKEYDSYGKALQQLSDYTAEVNKLLSDGYLKEGSEDYLEAMEKIQEFTKQVDESAIALVELKDKIREIDYTKLQQLIDRYDRRTEQLTNAQSLAEARDELVGRDELQKQVDELSKGINANYELRDKKLQEQNLYDVTSTRYQDLAKEIADLDNEIYSSLEDIEELKNKIFEAEFFNYDKEQENLKYFISELDDFANLLNEDGFFDKKGGFTDEAYAKISLTADAMAKCKQEIANATEALTKLDQMYKNGLISAIEYDERQKDLLDTIRDSVGATEDYKNELIDLYKKQIEKENDVLKENIKLRQDALKNARDYESFADSLKDKTKSVNELDAMINSLQGVNNSQAQAELKRLQQQKADAQKELDDLKKDHTYDLMDEGYSLMSENLDKSLEDLEYSITTSSEKQLSVVQSMLNQMVSSYSDAFSKISSIISNTGFVGTGSFNDTVSNVSTSTGSSSIASGAIQNPSTINPSDSASNINTSNIANGNHGAIETEIGKEPNVDNRLCAELTISKKSVSVQEGSQTSLSVTIRPNDAKNKTVSWKSSNPSIASVSSDGKVTGVKPGTASITVSTTDGSGLMQTCKVTVTKKPEPPKPVKPTQPTQPTNPQGNGVPDVGDKVTFVSGIYHEDSYGNGRWGNWNLGQSVYITSMNPNSPYPIHISTGNRLGSGDRGWLRLDQLRGYRKGSRRIRGNQWAWTQENNKDEVIFRASDGAMLTPLGDGDSIFSNEQVQKLWDWTKGNYDISRFVNLNTGSMLGQLPDIVNRNDNSQNTEVNLNFENLLTIEGNVSKEAIPGLQKEIDKMIPHISDKLGIFLRGEMKKL